MAQIRKSILDFAREEKGQSVQGYKEAVCFEGFCTGALGYKRIEEY